MERKITEILEDIKLKICDNYCRFPAEYKFEFKDPIIAGDMMLSEQCEKCPLNILS